MSRGKSPALHLESESDELLGEGARLVMFSRSMASSRERAIRFGLGATTSTEATPPMHACAAWISTSGSVEFITAIAEIQFMKHR